MSTPLAEDEVRTAGEAVLMMIGASVAMGHVSPNGLMDYVNRDDLDPTRALVWDAFAATRGDHEARARLKQFVEDRGLLDLIAEAVSR